MMTQKSVDVGKNQINLMTEVNQDSSSATLFIFLLEQDNNTRQLDSMCIYIYT